MKAWGFGGWTTLAIPNNIQKRLYKYLLKKAIGQFLANDLDFNSFDIQLSKGTVELRDLELNVQVSPPCRIIIFSAKQNRSFAPSPFGLVRSFC